MKKLMILFFALTFIISTKTQATEAVMLIHGKRIVVNSETVNCITMRRNFDKVYAGKSGCEWEGCDPNGSIAPRGSGYNSNIDLASIYENNNIAFTYIEIGRFNKITDQELAKYNEILKTIIQNDKTTIVIIPLTKIPFKKEVFRKEEKQMKLHKELSPVRINRN